MKRWLPGIGAGIGHLLIRPSFSWPGGPPLEGETWQWFVWLRASFDFFGGPIAVVLLALLYQRRVRDGDDRRAALLWLAAGSAIAMHSTVAGFGSSVLGLTLVFGAALGDYRPRWAGVTLGLGTTLLFLGLPSALLVFAPFAVVAFTTILRDKKARVVALVTTGLGLGAVFFLAPEKGGAWEILMGALSGGRDAEGPAGLRVLFGRDAVLIVGLVGWLHTPRLGLGKGLFRAGLLAWGLALCSAVFLGMGTEPTLVLAAGAPILGLGLAARLNRDMHTRAPWLGFILGSILFMVHADGFSTTQLRFRTPYWESLNGPGWLEYVLPVFALVVALWLVLRAVQRQSGLKTRVMHLGFALGTACMTIGFMRWANH